MKINRIYTQAGRSPYDGIRFESRSIESRNAAGAASQSGTIFVPAAWSNESVNVLATKYARRRGVPSNTIAIDDGDGVPVQFRRSMAAPDATFGGETDARKIFHRLAGCWTYYGIKHGYFDTVDDAQAYYDEASAMMALQIAAANSPQWFNTGLAWAYGILGDKSGYYYTDFETGEVRESDDLFTHPAPFACHILTVEDTLLGPNGIYEWLRNEAAIFKVGAGSGGNISALRGTGERLSGGGSSSGMMSFIAVSDKSAGAIKSGGTTRRAAKMLVCNIDHPDILAFVGLKVKEEQKVANLVTGSIVIEKHINAILQAAHAGTYAEAARFDVHTNTILRDAIRAALLASVPQQVIQQAIDLARQDVREVLWEAYSLTDWNGEAYATVTGQNANNSVRIPDHFFEALDRNGAWDLTRRTDGTVAHSLPAAELWDAIADAAWRVADPGVQYDTTFNDWHTVPNEGRINATNPCGEYASIDDSSCNLASLRLTAFLRDDFTFDVERFTETARLWTLTLEISVAAGQLPAPNLAANTWKIRNLGLGFADAGAMLMRLGIPYDSPDALSWMSAIASLECAAAYRASAELARDLGPFEAFARNRDAMLRVIRNHMRAAGCDEHGDYEALSVRPVTHAPTLDTSPIAEAARTEWRSAYEIGEQHGFRNSQVVVIAPTGTIGIVLGCDTTGIEPDFALVKAKRLAGSNWFMLVNRSVQPALRRLGYGQHQIEAIDRFVLGTRTFAGAPHINRDTLRAKGLSDASIALLEQQLPGVYDFDFVFVSTAITEDDQQKLGLTPQIMAKPNGILLHLGFTQAEIREAADVVTGRGTIEGAPHVRKEHLAVFDCATPVGRTERFIRPLAHVDMLAAVQPFVSGAVSKTVNMPRTASIADVKEVYRYAHRTGVKAIALYRDGSKFAQPLSSTDDLDLSQFDGSAPIMANAVTVAERVVYRYIAQQRRLPNKRDGYVQKLSIGGQKFYLRTGQYEDGTLGEIFIDGHKEGATMRALLNSFAMAISTGLQYGVPLEEFVDAFTFTRFEPHGMVTGDDHIKMGTSILDLIFRHLGINYLGRTDLAHIQPGDVKPTGLPSDIAFIAESEGDGRYGAARNGAALAPAPPATPASTNGHSNGATALAASAAAASSNGHAITAGTAGAHRSGFTGDTCGRCSSSRVVRTGTCATCLDCGTSVGGCS